MTTQKGPLGPRVGDLETAVAELKRTTAQLKRDQSATRRLVRELKKQVDGILPGVDEKLAEQTQAINDHADRQSAAMKTWVLTQLLEAVRQWPPAALVAVTAVLALVAAVAAVWILNVTGHLHFG